MPRVTLVRYTTKAGRAAENEALSRAVFMELRDTRPGHIAYALLRDGDDFVHLFVNAVADDSDAVTELPSFKAFSKDAGDRYVAQPDILRLSLNLVDAYGLTGR